MKNLAILLGILILGTIPAYSQDTMSRPSRAVLDSAHILTPEQENEFVLLNRLIDKADSTLGYVIILDSLPARDIGNKNYTKGLFKKWDLNNAHYGRNFIIVYTLRERGLRIEASDQLIKALGKDYISHVISDSMFPLFRQKKDFEALRKGYTMIADKLTNN